MGTAPFVIATLDLAEGGRLGICPLPGAGGDLVADLATIAAWRPALVVGLTEQAEMETLGSGALGPMLRQRGIPWRHLPIRDFGGLEGASLAAWPALAAELHALLDQGRAVLIHCRGGQGRSGMLALRLLVERGRPANAALAALRARRPGAVETEQQRLWAAAGSVKTGR